ncbi:MAG: beta-glucuronidase, partial [Bacteroidota bacterium]|nr:beta-glucuronidase [Bacteroidota bacterium]
MKKILLFLLVLGALFHTVHAQENLIQNIYTRNSVSLDGRWHYIIDPFETGFRYFQGATADQGGRLSGFFENARPGSKSALVEYDFNRSPTLNVPGDWNSQNPQLLYYEGTVWYQRDFEVHLEKGMKYFLHFGAINYEAYVSVNDRKAGVHAGGFTPFEYDVTSLLHEGENFIVIKVNNTRRKEAVPTDNFDWWNYGGITRDVLLVKMPATYIRDYRVQLAKGDLHHINGFVQLEGPDLSQPVRIQIPGAGLNTTLTADNQGRVHFSFPVRSLQYWSPEHPHLYEVHISTPTDSVTDRVGFRTIEAKGTQILLNGKPVFLRGICLHDENPLIPGRPRSTADCRMLLNWAKSLHCNFIRLAHYPHMEVESRLADSMGIMLWEEVPVYWTIDWTNDSTLKNAEHQMTDLISGDKNRASVIVWSIGNETPNIPTRERFMEAMADTTHRLDDSRLVTAALLTRNSGDSVFVDDPLGKKLDLVSFNEYLGWYSKEMPWQIGKFHFTIPYDKPAFISELGAGALGGFHADSATRFSEEFQASVY